MLSQCCRCSVTECSVPPLISSRMWCAIHSTHCQNRECFLLLLSLPPCWPRFQVHWVHFLWLWSRSLGIASAPAGLRSPGVAPGWQKWGQTRGGSCPRVLTRVCPRALQPGQGSSSLWKDSAGAWCCALSLGTLNFPPEVIGTELKPSPARAADILYTLMSLGSASCSRGVIGILLQVQCKSRACPFPWAPVNWDQWHWSSAAVVSLTLPGGEFNSIWTVFLLFHIKSIAWTSPLAEASQRHLNGKVPFLRIF